MFKTISKKRKKERTRSESADRKSDKDSKTDQVIELKKYPHQVDFETWKKK